MSHWNLSISIVWNYSLRIMCSEPVNYSMNQIYFLAVRWDENCTCCHLYNTAVIELMVVVEMGVVWAQLIRIISVKIGI